MARANNEGSVHKSKSDGRWVAAPSYRTETGRRWRRASYHSTRAGGPHTEHPHPLEKGCISSSRPSPSSHFPNLRGFPMTVALPGASYERHGYCHRENGCSKRIFR